MHDLTMWRKPAIIASLALLAGCSAHAESERLRVTPELSDWRPGALGVTHRMVLGYLETRKRFLGRDARLSMCMPLLPLHQQDSLRALLRRPNVRLQCPAATPNPDTVEHLLAESMIAEGDSVILRLRRVAPGDTVASWTEMYVGLRDLIGGAFTIRDLPPSTPSSSRDPAVAVSPDSLILAYLRTRRSIDVRPATETLCVETADTALNTRLQRKVRIDESPTIRYSSTCGRLPHVRDDVLRLEIPHGRSDLNTLAVRVHRASGVYPPSWFERFTLSSNGVWQLYLGGQPAVD